MSGTSRRRARATSTLPVVADLPRVVVRRGDMWASLVEAPDVDAVAVPVAPPADGEESVQPRTGTAEAAARYGIDLSDLAERVGADGSAGSVHTVYLPRPLAGATMPWGDLPPRVVLVGVGTGAPADLRRAGAALARAGQGLGTVVTTVGSGSGRDGTRALVEGYLLGAYRHPSAAASSPPDPAGTLVLLGAYAPVDVARHTAAAAWVARVLTVTPSSTKTPAWMADQAVEAATAAGLEVEVLGPAELAARGFAGLVAVGGGSVHGPRLVIVRHDPGVADADHVVIAGKGITFDTGGLAVKPRESMTAMKTDMAGAAVALATVLGAAALGIPRRVTALLALAENAVGGASYRPGDVLRLGGTTVEVVNPDAEGRLVLADVLHHADTELDPDVLIDVATLTGAATMGLGKHHGALFTPDDALAESLTAAAAAAGEPLWRMPLVDDYGSALESPVAQVRHVADPAVGGGAITAALFLQRFVGARRWAHLDIAGPARAAAAAHEVPEGATGFGVRALLRWLG